MFNLSDTAKGLIKNVAVICFVFLGIYCLIDFSNILPFLFGLSFGFIFTILKIILLEKNIQHAVELTGSKADNYMKLHFLLRYVLTGVVLAVCGVFSSISLIGCVLAIMSLQISAYSINFFKKVKK